MNTRLAPSTFDIPVTQIRSGYRSAIYFDRTRSIMAEEKPEQVVTMQVFQKTEGATVCGVDEALAILRTCAGHYSDPVLAKGYFNEYQEAKRSLRARPGDTETRKVRDEARAAVTASAICVPSTRSSRS